MIHWINLTSGAITAHKSYTTRWVIGIMGVVGRHVMESRVSAYMRSAMVGAMTSAVSPTVSTTFSTDCQNVSKNTINEYLAGLHNGAQGSGSDARLAKCTGHGGLAPLLQTSRRQTAAPRAASPKERSRTDTQIF